MVTKLEIKEKYNLNQDGLEWLIDILNPDQYEKVESKDCKTDILFIKDNNVYMLLDTLDNNHMYLNYNLIWLAYNDKFGDNYMIFKSLTKYILNNVYKLNISETQNLSIL